jgi:hypothetical protein
VNPPLIGGGHRCRISIDTAGRATTIKVLAHLGRGHTGALACTSGHSRMLSRAGVSGPEGAPSLVSPSGVWRGVRCVAAQPYARPSLSVAMSVH